MKLLRKIILCSAIVLAITIIVYFAYSNTTQDISPKDVDDSKNTKLIKWGSGSLFDIFVDPKDIAIIDGGENTNEGYVSTKIRIIRHIF